MIIDTFGMYMFIRSIDDLIVVLMVHSINVLVDSIIIGLVSYLINILIRYFINI